MSVLRGRGVIPYAEKGNVGNKKSEDITRYKIVKPNDIVVNSMNVIIGSVGLSRYSGCLSPVYYVLTLQSEQDNHRYMDALFQTTRFQKSLVRIGNGILAHRMRIPMELLKCENLPYPPVEEQADIVRFLDHIDTHISRCIRVKRKLIKLLKELRQAIIDCVVTGNINDDFFRKQSGMGWLGTLSKHWDRRRLRHLVREKLTYGANAAAEHTRPDWPRYLRITDFSSNGRLREDTFRSLPPHIASEYSVDCGDILLARSGATVGKAFMVEKECGPACHAGYLIRVRLDESMINPEFFFTFTQSSAFHDWKNVTLITATIENISAEKYADMIVPIPPLNEQCMLLDGLRDTRHGIDRAVDKIQQEIALIIEYRTRLFFDVVTGKYDVRQVASQTFE